jgi:hypothetical protein
LRLIQLNCIWQHPTLQRSITSRDASVKEIANRMQVRADPWPQFLAIGIQSQRITNMKSRSLNVFLVKSWFYFQEGGTVEMLSQLQVMEKQVHVIQNK